jgi:hypothetical protein
VCGNKLAQGNNATLVLAGAAPGAQLLLLVASAPSPTYVPLLQEQVVAYPPFFIGSFQADASGALTLPVHGGGGPTTLTVQVLAANGAPTLYSVSNAVEVEFFE